MHLNIVSFILSCLGTFSSAGESKADLVGFSTAHRTLLTTQKQILCSNMQLIFFTEAIFPIKF